MKRAHATSAKFECKQSLKTVPRGQSKFCRAVLVAHGFACSRQFARAQELALRLRLLPSLTKRGVRGCLAFVFLYCS